MPAPQLPVTIEGVTFAVRPFRLWDRDQRRVGFRNVEHIQPTRMVPKGRRSIPLPLALLDFSKVTYSYEGRVRTVDDYVADTNVAGLLVIHRGRIVLERYESGHDQRSAWTSFSVAKSVTSMLFGAALADESIRSLDDLVTAYIPALRGSAYDDVTIRQLLRMSSGVAWNENYDDPAADLYKIPSRLGIDAHLAYMKALPRRAPPGSTFNYNTGETDIAGEVLRRATRRTLAEYLSEKIWSRAGMESDAYWMTIRSGDVESAGCCLSATLRDYGRLGLLALRDGVGPDGRRLLPSGWIAESTAPSPANPSYGYFWWLSSPPGRFAAAGIYGQSIAVDPANEIVIVIQSFWDRPTTSELSNHRTAFREAMREAVVSRDERH
jgi:CubicO group peptidase (beta-lactamase class C family)